MCELPETNAARSLTAHAVAKERKMTARRIHRRHKTRLFLPTQPDLVRHLASLRWSDKEIAKLYGCEEIFAKWKRYYPSFKAAIEEGCAEADAADVEVVVSTYQAAVGYSHEEEVLFNWQGSVIRTTRTKHYPPDMKAAKFWITNRQKQHWKDRQHLAVSGGSGDEFPIGISIEKKQEVTNAILALVHPKPDGDPDARVTSGFE